MIMKMFGNRSFTTGKWQAEQVATPQGRRTTGICPGTPSLNICTYDLPTILSRKYAYAAT